MKKFLLNPVFTIGIAIFSMFFGAGNIIFPLLLGAQMKGSIFWAFLGLSLTAIGGPFLGLFTATLYKGRVKEFFSRFGKYPGAFLMGVCLLMLGPLAALPRCVSVAYGAVQMTCPAIPLSLFIVGICLLIYLCCVRQGIILPLLGYVLSPMLLASLCLVIFYGITSPLALPTTTTTPMLAAWQGLGTGYDTMDLIASIFFSAGIWHMVGNLYPNNPKKTYKTALFAGLIGCSLLGLVYLGLSYTAALYSHALVGVAPQKLIYVLSYATLGPHMGLIATIAIALACFTTLISLVMALSNIITDELLPNKLSYKTTCALILSLTMLISFVNFSTILHLIHGIMIYCYPAIIVLTLYNLVHKLRKPPTVLT